MLENQKFVKEEVGIDKEGNGDESVLYWKRVKEVLKNQIEICPTEGKMQLCAAVKERVLHPMDTSIFNTLKGRVRQRVLRPSANRIF